MRKHHYLGTFDAVRRGQPLHYYAGIDVSLEASSVCVMDGAGKIVREAKVASEPNALICKRCDAASSQNERGWA